MENAQVRCLTTLLKYALKGQQISEPQLEQLMQGVDEEELFSLARAHAVAPLIYDAWTAYQGMKPSVRTGMQAYTLQIVGHSYRLLFYTKYLVGLLEREGLPVAVLKGVATAEFYPQPELRKAGDVDLLLFSEENCARAVACLAPGEPAVKESEYLDRFFLDIIEAEEFGKSDKGRMLAIHGQGLTGYIRAFHHQMRLNYPKAGKCPLCWPVLWVLTLARFLHNNRTLRGTTAGEILKSAGKRGKIVDKMHLFE